MNVPITYGLKRNAALNPDGIAYVFGETRRTWREVAARVAKFAGALRTMGVDRGDRVCVLAWNSGAFVEALLAIPWAGAIVTGMNTRWALPEMLRVAREIAPRVLMVDDAFVEEARAIRESCPCIERLLWIGAGAVPSGFESLESALEKAAPAADVAVAADECFAIFHTSGTTGLPKAVMIAAAGCHQFGVNAMLTSVRPDSVIAHTMPMFHIGGAVLILGQILAGARGVILPRFDPAPLLAAIERERITHALWVPSMIRLLLDNDAFGRHDVTSLQHITYGAAPMPTSLLNRALAAFPLASFWHVYSMTESSGVTTLLPPEAHDPRGPNQHRLRSAGRAALGVELKIVGPDGAELGPGQPGEICVRGPVCLGYWQQPELTRSAMHEGWFHSGDGGSMDEDGYLYVLDRLKDMIISGGENVYAIEVETALLRHAAVAECAVIGLPDERWGEAVTAIVRRHPGMAVTPEELTDHCRAHVTSYKCPRCVIFREEPFPLSGAGKVLKAELRRAYVKQGGMDGRARRA